MMTKMRITKFWILLLVLTAPTLRAGAQGVVWRDSTLDQALAEAASSDRILMVDVRANHCGQCIVMETEFWNTPDGAAFAADMIPLKIDSTMPAGADLTKRYPITGLPCVVFIRPDGTEIDRVVGYETKSKFLDEAGQLKNGIDPLPDMEKALAAHPDSLPTHGADSGALPLPLAGSRREGDVRADPSARPPESRGPGGESAHADREVPRAHPNRPQAPDG